MRLLASFISALVLALAPFSASAQVTGPSIPLTGSIGVPGSAAILGGGTLQLSADANHTLSAAEYATHFLQVTSSVSLTATRNLVGPANQGQDICLENATTGGQSLQVIAASGTGVTIPNGATTCVFFDGTNYVTNASASVTAAAVQSAITPQTGCSTPGYAWSPQSNTCVAVGGSVASAANIYGANSQVQADSIVGLSTNGLYCFGESFIAGTGATVPATTGQCADVGSDLGISSLTTNYAVNGDTSYDFAYHVLTSLNPADSGNPLVLATDSINNIPNGSGSAAVTAFEQNYYAAFAWGTLSSSYKILAGASPVTKTGTTAANTTFANANGLNCTAGPCTFTLTSQNVGNTGVVYVWYPMVLSGGGTISAKIDGTTVTDTVVGAASTPTLYGYSGNNQTLSAGMARYVTTPGAHTIVVTVTTGGGILGFGFPGTDRDRGASGPRMVMGGTGQKPGLSSVTTAAYNAASISVQVILTADGRSIPFVDLLNVYDQNCDFVLTATPTCPASQASGHPSDGGHRKAANRWESVLNGASSYINPFPSSVANAAGMFNANPANVVPGGVYTFAPGILFQRNPTNPGYEVGIANAGYGGTPWMVFFEPGYNLGWQFCTYVSGTALSSTNQCNSGGGYQHTLPAPTANDYILTTTNTHPLVNGTTFATNTCTFGTTRDACAYISYDDGGDQSGTSAGPSFAEDIFTTGGAIEMGVYNHAHTSWTPYLTITPSTNSMTASAAIQLADYSAVAQFKLPTIAGYTTTQAGELGYDTTNHNWHANTGSDTFVASFSSSSPPTSGDCAKFVLTLNQWNLADAGGPCLAPISNTITSATYATGITSATCVTASCTNLRGSYTIVGGTFTGGTFLTLVWPTTTTAYVCTVTQNNTTGETTSFLSIGHSVATATGMTISSGITLASQTFTVDYHCLP